MDTVRAARIGYLYAAWLFVACAVIQVFLAGLGVFAGADNFGTHREFGYLFGWLTLLLLALGAIGRLPRRRLWLTALLLLLFATQSLLVAARQSFPAIAALHPVNGFAIVWLAIWLARQARLQVVAPPAAVEAQTAP